MLVHNSKNIKRWHLMAVRGILMPTDETRIASVMVYQNESDRPWPVAIGDTPVIPQHNQEYDNDH
jgi:hypothetical protein